MFDGQTEIPGGVQPIAVLIDADNVSPAAADEIFDIVGRLGEPIVRRAYGMVSCFSSADGWLQMQRRHGIVARPQTSNVAHKNVADIALVIDAMSLLYRSPCQAICIVSSDSDFAALAAKIREEGKMAYGVGDEKAPAGFRSACNRFFTLSAHAKKAPAAGQGGGVCPRCGVRLTMSRTKSRQNCRVCPECHGASVKLTSLGSIFAEDSLNDLLERARLHEQPGCVCPDCGAQMTLLKVSAGKRHVEIDVCAECRSIWYDRDELEALVPNDGPLVPTVSAGKAFRRDMVAALAADLRGGKLKAESVAQLKEILKGVYRVPAPDIMPVIGALQCQRIIAVDGKTGKIS